jgi:coenzyme F420 hydrogenase subunit beta
MKAIDAVWHLRREQPRRTKHMNPAHAWQLAQPCRLTPGHGERE